MRDKTIRATGATVVLLGIAVAALMQMDRGGDPSAISLTADGSTPTTTALEASTLTLGVEPFTYSLGVLAGVSTTNFWAFYGDQPSVWNSYILGPTKPALFTLDRSGDLQSELAVEQATPISDGDDWSVVVTLDNRFAWSDGQPVTAQDFVFTFETVRSLGLGGSWSDAFPETIQSVHAQSEHQLRIEFAQRPNLALWPHGPGLAPLMPAHIWERHVVNSNEATLYGLNDVTDVGGGPLALQDVTDDLIVSVANTGYPLKSVPDKVEYHVFADESAAADALAAGAIDTILSPNGLTSVQVESLSSHPEVAVETNPANGVRYLGFNLNRAPMSEIAFRDALALLVDREGLVERIDPVGKSTYVFVSGANARWFDAEAADGLATRFQTSLDTRLESALIGLRSGGYTWVTEPLVGSDGLLAPGVGLQIDGIEPAPLTILTTGDVHDLWRPQYAEEIAETLGLLGFDVRPVETDFDTVVDLAFTADAENALHYDMYLLGWTLGSPALPSYYRTLFAADGEQNNTGYNSEMFATQLTEYESSFDIAQARKALWHMEATLAADLPYLLLYSSSITEVYRADQVAYNEEFGLGGLQARLGGILDVSPALNG